jgi:uncharacterized membrane protein
MSKLASLPRGAIVGALLMYFLDPARGRKRRARLRDRTAHFGRELGKLANEASADTRHRAHGILERARGPAQPDAGDHVLEARVRSKLGRVVSHAHAIDVAVDGAVATLRGPILAREVDEAIRAVRHVPGIHDVIDELDRHTTAEHPSLVSERVRVRRERWTPSARGFALIGGAGLVTFGLVRRGLVGALAAAAGTGLAARGAFDQPLGRLVRLAAGRDGISIEKTITVMAPIDLVFDLWSRFEGFPRFMQHVKRIEIDRNDPLRSRWTVDGPANTPMQFDAITTHLERPHEIGWATIPGQRVEHTGVVRFEQIPDGTRVHLHMTYRPPGGVVGHEVAKLLGMGPRARIDEDLLRMKSLLEQGRTRAHGVQVREPLPR